MITDSTFVDDFFGDAGTNFLAQIQGTSTLVRLFLQTSVVIAGIILLYLAIMGGIGIIAGSGQSDPQKIEKGKKALTSAIIGFILIIGSYWIIRIIEIISGTAFITGQGLP